MPKKEKTKSLMDQMDETIMNLEDRIGELKHKLSRFQGDEGSSNEENAQTIEALNREITTTEKQLDYCKTAKLEFEEQLNKDEKEEENRKIESALKMAIIVGAIRENLRLCYERDRRFEKKLELNLRQKAERETVKVMEEENFRFFTMDMLDEVMNNKEFARMAEEDPNAIEHEEINLKDEYEAAIEQSLRMAGMELGHSFEENEKKFQKFQNENNGYSRGLYNLKNSPYKEDYLKLGSKEDQKLMKEIMDEINELQKITLALQEEFVSGESNFFNGNGFTKKLVDREFALVDKIEKFKKSIWDDRMMKGNDNYDNVGLYTILEFMRTPIQKQAEKDRVLQKTNEHRKKSEMWTVYKRLPKNARPDIKQVSEMAEIEAKAWLKMQRMNKEGMKKGGIYLDTSTWASEKVKNVYDACTSEKRISSADKEKIRDAMAALVLHQILDDELSREQDHKKRPFYDRYITKNCKESFDELTSEIANSDEFKKVFKAYTSGGDFKEKCLKVLAYDKERTMANEFKNLLIGREKEIKRGRKKEEDLPRKVAPVLTPQN